MSSTVLAPPDKAQLFNGPAARILTVITALLFLLGGIFLPPPPAQAATLGVGYGDSSWWLGSFSSHGRQAYCMDLLALPPYGTTQHPELRTTLDSLTDAQLAQLNYVLATWGETSDPNVAAAVQLYVWDVADHSNYINGGGDAHYVNRVPESQRGTVLSYLATMRSEATAKAVTNPSVSISVEMSDQYAGQITVNTHPASLTGVVTLTNAVFTGGSNTATLGSGSYEITGTPAEGAASYKASASISATSAPYGAGVDLFYTPGEQRILGAASFSPLKSNAVTPQILLDFQPELTTQVSTKFVQAGDPLIDKVAVTVTKHSWIRIDGAPIPVVAEGTLYGPFDQQPDEAAAPPLGAPIAGVEELTLTGSGSYVSAGSIIAEESGFYTWVWGIDKEAQGSNSKYLTDSFIDRFGQVSETSVVPFQPEAISKANGRLLKPGENATDSITVSSTNGVWLKNNGDYIPVIFEGTAYQVSGSLPPEKSATVPADATEIGAVTVTAVGPGTYTSPSVNLPDPGFVTWVWKVSKDSQPEWVRPYIAADWQDSYGINIETHSVRWPIKITSEVREYNVHSGGRAFDRITVTGFPENHPEFVGDDYWKADTPIINHTVYGPFTNDAELTEDLDLGKAPILTSIETPAKNGIYDIGYDDEDRIQPTEPGFYVIVSSFDGDDRVQPFVSSPAEIWERFFVPKDEQPISVITQAQEEANVGEPFEDTALVQGSKIPEGAYLVFRAYGPQDALDSPTCEVPSFVSEKIFVTQAGTYKSGPTVADHAGNVYWVETLYNAEGEVIAQGTCGAPDETTVINELPPGTPEQPNPPTPPTPDSPPKLPELPVTGGGILWPVGVAIAVVLMTSGVVLWFGRKLALFREANGEFDDLITLDDLFDEEATLQ